MNKNFFFQKSSNKESNKSFLIGGGEATQIFLKNPISHQYNILGIFDDNEDLQGKSLDGIPILGTINQLKSFVDEKIVKYVIYLIPSIQIDQYRDLFQDIQQKYPSIEWLATPPLNDISQGLKSLFELTNLNILPVNNAPSNLAIPNEKKAKFYGKVAFITGGSGSIGSKVVEELLISNIFKTIVVIDSSEMNSYQLSQSFSEDIIKKKVIIHLTDFGEVNEMDSLFYYYQPSIIYHAGAYKHVNLLEKGNVYSAIQNNVIKSIHLVNAALKHDCIKTFILVSSDKAVNPSSVMGYTKRLVEITLNNICHSTHLDMITVRFGNVVASNGSVFHKFLRQIKGQQKITLTDIGVTRYFMNISQAASLIIKISLIGKRGKVYVLNMGKPVRIYDFLIEMINKYGEPKQKDSVVITGLQPGEKLNEELHYHKENIKPLDEEIFVGDFLANKIDVKILLKQFSQWNGPQDEELLKSWLFKYVKVNGDF